MRSRVFPYVRLCRDVVLARANQGFLSVPLFAEEPYFLNDDAYDALGVPELRRHAVLHDIPTRTATDVRKATLLARLKEARASYLQRRETAKAEALERVVIDTDPRWVIKLKVSLAKTPEQIRLDRGASATKVPTDVTKKYCSPFWESGVPAPEPDTSIKISQQIAAILACKDNCADQRKYFILHWAIQSVPPTAA